MKNHRAGHPDSVWSLLHPDWEAPWWPPLSFGEATVDLQAIAMETAANGMVITDLTGKVLWVNDAFGRMTGYAPSEVFGRKISLLKSGKHSPQFYAELWNCILRGNVWRGEVVNARKDGELFLQEQTITPIRGVDGSITHFLSIQEDASDRKCMYAALRDLERRQAVDIERERVARDMHDELGASLTRIKLLAERLEQDAMDPQKTIAYGRMIGATTRRLAETLDEIVWAVDPRKDRLENLGSYVISYAEEFLRVAGLRCRLDFPEVLPDVPLPAPMRRRVFLVIKEALNNVVKHAGASEVRLTLGVRHGVLNVNLEDNGHGFCVQRANVKRNGLCNMRRRIEECGGRFRVHSLPGKGTRIQLSLRIC